MYLLLAQRYLQYLFSGKKAYDFWDWLFVRVCSEDSSDFRNPRLVWFLIAHALESGEHHQVVAVYSYFKDIVDEKATPKYLARIDASVLEAQRLQTMKPSAP